MESSQVSGGCLEPRGLSLLPSLPSPFPALPGHSLGAEGSLREGWARKLKFQPRQPLLWPPLHHGPLEEEQEPGRTGESRLS